MRILKVFIITFGLTFAAQVVLDLPTVKIYFQKQIRTAKMLCLCVKYNVKPEGLSS